MTTDKTMATDAETHTDANAVPAEPTPAPESAPTPVEDAELKALREQAAKATENWEKFVRATADLDNFRKRAARERQDAIRYANEALLEKLIPLVDNFDAALMAASSTQGTSVDSLKTGITMIHTQLRGILKEAGLDEVDAAGQVFDPALHEAVSQQESAEVPEGHVVSQLRKGYRLKERLVRPATVIVAKKPAA